MAIFDSLLSSLKKDEDFKAAQKARKIEKLLDEREKSVHERNLENFLERKRQEQIKKKMDKINLEQSRGMLFGGNGREKNIFLNHAPVLNTDNMFLRSKRTKEKGMFFK
ncbi:hypothetical protein LCGC14_0571330 [marine sediment metagenome]|uniref:Uncharacterized protein n=1 Tax=marine sediment metagenome TaxID=412755 RepID=A0A0F9RJ71_9ZZZZ